MKKFKYRGYTTAAVERRGTIEGEDYLTAYAALAQQELTVVELQPVALTFLQVTENYWLKFRIGGQWPSVFFRELSVMLGVMSLNDALTTLSTAAAGHPTEKILSELALAAADGQSFSVALSRYEQIFGNDAIQSIEIGDASGNLQDVTARLAIQLERSCATTKKVRGAMYYPIFVLFAALVAAVVLVNVTLPVFENFFEQRGGELPLLTIIFLHGGKFLSENFLLTAGVLLACGIFFVTVYEKSEAVKFFFDKLKLRTKLLREVELRNFFGRLSFLIDSGVELDEALKLCAAATKNLFVKKILSEMEYSVGHGDTLGAQVAEKKFPPLYVGLIVTGETGGQLVDMLRQCESMADFEVEEILRGLPAKAEIFGTLIAGLIVATMVFAVMLPILDTTNLL